MEDSFKLLEKIELKKAIYYQNKNGSIIIRNYFEDSFRYPSVESLVEDMCILIYENNKYHITGTIIVDEFYPDDRYVNRDEFLKIKNIQKESHDIRLIKRKSGFFLRKEYEEYEIPSGWYSTEERLPLDVTCYGKLTIIKYDNRK